MVAKLIYYYSGRYLKKRRKNESKACPQILKANAEVRLESFSSRKMAYHPISLNNSMRQLGLTK